MAGRSRDIYTIAVHAYQRAYVESLYPTAARVCGKYDVDPTGILTLAAIETAWGRALIPDSHNHFMLLADPTWSGLTVGQEVERVYAGTLVRRAYVFKRYYSLEDCFLDVLGALQSTPKLYRAFQHNKNPRIFLSKLRDAKFITPHPEDETLWPAKEHTLVLVRVEKILASLRAVA